MIFKIIKTIIEIPILIIVVPVAILYMFGAAIGTASRVDSWKEFKRLYPNKP